MKIYDLQVQKREVTGKKVQEYREKSLVPGVVYGSELKENLLLFADLVQLEKLYSQAGESSIINLTIGDSKEPVEVLIKDVVYEPVTMRISHIDFYKIRRGQKIEAMVGINFINKSPLVKEVGAIVVEAMDEIQIKCLPKDLMSEIEVDLAQLKKVDDIVYVKDLNIPADVEVLANKEDVVVSISIPRDEVIEEKPLDVELPAGAEPEKEGGKEGEKTADEKEKK